MSGKYVPPYLRGQAGSATAAAAPPAAAAPAPASAAPSFSGAASTTSPPIGSPGGVFGAEEQQQSVGRRGVAGAAAEVLSSGGITAPPPDAASPGTLLQHPPSHGVHFIDQQQHAAGSPPHGQGLTALQQQQQRVVSGHGIEASNESLQQQGVSPSSGNSQQQQRWSQVLMGYSGAAGGGRGRYGGRAAAGQNTGLKVVEIDGLVLLKVLKHCRENYPTPVNGQLLGIDSKDRLEVTNCFPLPQKKDMLLHVQRGSGERVGDFVLEERLDEEFDKYQDKMAELMHDVHVDCFTVGWYQTLSFGDLNVKQLLDSLALYQEEVEKAVLLGFDPALSALGRPMAFRAFHLRPEFLHRHYHECEQDVSKYNRLKASDILQEVSIVVVNPCLVEGFLQDWGGSCLSEAYDLDSLAFDQLTFVEKNMCMLSLSLDYIAEEQDKLQRYQRDYLKQQLLQKQVLERRRLENEQRRLRGEPLLTAAADHLDSAAFRKIEQPSQLNTLLLSSHAQQQCVEVNAACSEALAKLFLLHWGVNGPATVKNSAINAAAGGVSNTAMGAAGLSRRSKFPNATAGNAAGFAAFLNAAAQSSGPTVGNVPAELKG